MARKGGLSSSRGRKPSGVIRAGVTASSMGTPLPKGLLHPLGVKAKLTEAWGESSTHRPQLPPPASQHTFGKAEDTMAQGFACPEGVIGEITPKFSHCSLSTAEFQAAGTPGLKLILHRRVSPPACSAKHITSPLHAEPNRPRTQRGLGLGAKLRDKLLSSWQQVSANYCWLIFIDPVST